MQCKGNFITPMFYSDKAMFGGRAVTGDRRKLKVLCPCCGRRFAPLLSTHTRQTASGMRVVDGEDTPFGQFRTRCSKCGRVFGYFILSST